MCVPSLCSCSLCSCGVQHAYFSTFSLLTVLKTFFLYNLVCNPYNMGLHIRLIVYKVSYKVSSCKASSYVWFFNVFERKTIFIITDLMPLCIFKNQEKWLCCGIYLCAALNLGFKTNFRFYMHGVFHVRDNTWEASNQPFCVSKLSL